MSRELDPAFASSDQVHMAQRLFAQTGWRFIHQLMGFYRKNSPRYSKLSWGIACGSQQNISRLFLPLFLLLSAFLCVNVIIKRADG
jgi:hypothetical protein